MVRSSFLATAIAAALSMNLHLGLVMGLFSVHDDILAFPQFQVSIIMDSYYTEEEAAQILSSSPQPNPSSSPSPESPDPTTPLTTYETLFWNTHKYLCSIPIVQPPPPMNATEKELHKLQEEKELARATTRGWELLNEMGGECLYFVSGWWSYSFCYGNEIKQFHQLPAGSGTMESPPKEDPGTASYVLGRVEGGGSSAGGRGPARKGAAGEGTELQGTGELRYLVQKMGGGTICDITGKERRIEVQYHCNPSSVDRIGFVKEVSICCYLMVVYTPRLCNDVAFLPPSEGRANVVKCKEVLGEEGIVEWKVKREKEERLKKLVGEFERAVDGEGEGKKRVKGIGGGGGGAGKKGKAKKDTGRKGGEKVAVREREKKEKVVEKRIKVKGENDDEIILLLPEELEFLVDHEEL